MILFLLYINQCAAQKQDTYLSSIQVQRICEYGEKPVRQDRHDTLINKKKTFNKKPTTTENHQLKITKLTLRHCMEITIKQLIEIPTQQNCS